MEERIKNVTHSNQPVRSTHKVTLTARNTAVITGVLDVLSFDPNEVLLETELGMLLLRGEELHVNRLNLEKGEVDVDGRVDSMLYSERNSYKKDGESLLKKLFR